MNKLIHINKIIAILFLAIIFSVLLYPIQHAFAYNPPQSISEDDIKNMDFDSNYVVFKTASGGYAYGKSKDVFFWLKENHGDDAFTGDKNNKYAQWKDLSSDSLSDGIDCIIFGWSLGSGNMTMIFTLKHTVCNVLEIHQSEYTFIEKFIDAMIPVGFSICLLHALLAIIDKSEKELLSPLCWILWGAKYGTGVAFVAQSKELAALAYSLSNVLLSKFIYLANNPSTTVYTEAELVSLAMQCDTEDIFAAIGSIFGHIGDLIVSTIVGDIVVLLLACSCYARKLEIALRSIFLPIGLADMVGHGVNGAGMKYFKKLLACAFQAAGIVFLVVLGSNLTVTSGVPMSGLMIPIAILGSTAMASKIADEAWG